MTEMYNKLFTKILDSSVWMEEMPTRIVWITFIAMMDEAGMVALSSVQNVAHRARVSPEEAAEAIATLESPDKVNPDQEHEGRRIERVPNVGWTVLNADKYRDMVTRAIALEKNRFRVAKHREKTRKSVTTTRGPVTTGNGAVMPANDLVMQSEVIRHDHKESLVEAYASPRDTALKPFLVEVWNYYLEKTGRSETLYGLTPARLKKGMTCLKYGIKRWGTTEAAVHNMKGCVEALAASGWHMGENDKGTKYCEWDKHLFHSVEKMEFWLNRRVGQ